ncbi:uncharacterized protein LOC106934524 [Poecilia latipinna]|uniref:uncharacterized protein LOC106934524 n=1 Tax=Poecilia latipinna TaxID=48699 RepID=UPI000443C06F|nr:PREDICTED: uncharacterized protein LOC106934524 [Poecilia latipinna]XP_016531928.1 PREDICTED: uncharacterized protein LOC103144910 [Poecilia formosa]
MRDASTDLLQKPVIYLEKLEKLPAVKHIHHFESTKGSDEWNRLMKLAEENCTSQTVLKWLRENSFAKLVDMFKFFKKHIDEEEKKNHSNTVDITFLSHGCIRDFMIPASCLLPLASIRDVVLYAPWNCVSGGAEITYAIATGKLKPQHRVFYCTKKDGCPVPDEKHRPIKLPDRWNSMRQAGDQMIPNISVSPLRPDDKIWKSFESLTKKYGPIGRNRIIIPFILPGEESDSVPFSVVTLALSLVLLQPRFRATVHLDACLTDLSTGQKFDREYLEKQYAYAADGTGMKCSNIFSFLNRIIQWIQEKTKPFFQVIRRFLKYLSFSIFN